MGMVQMGPAETYASSDRVTQSRPQVNSEEDRYDRKQKMYIHC